MIRNGKTRPHITHSFRVQDALGIPVEQTEDFVWLNKTVKCRRHTIHGVSAKQIDVLIADPLYDWDYVLLICRKTGRFDDAERDQWVFRPYSKKLSLEWPTGRVKWDDNKLSVESDGETKWEKQYVVLKSDLSDYDCGRIVLWHWTRYYRFIPRDEAESAATYFVTIMDQPGNPITLAEANRAASRLLYDLARNLGWRKLTLREQTKYGVTGQWHRVEKLSTITGCGEYTEREARGVHPRD